MATIKIVLDTRRPKSDGTYPLKYRVFQNAKYRDIPLSIFLKIEDWDEPKRQVKKSHPNYKLLNHRILKQYSELEATLLKVEADEAITLDDLSAKMKGKSKEKPLPDFFEYGFTWVERLQKGGKVGNARAYENTLKRLKSYLGHTKLKFTDINFDFLEDFQANMLSKGVKQNTISFYLRTVRTIFNKAIKAKVTNRTNYPFEDFSIKHESTQKRAVGKGIIQMMENAELPEGTPIWHHRNYFLLSFYLIGISFVDLAYLKWNDIKEGRVVYKRRKTGKIYSIKLVDKALQILNYYREVENATPYILPIIPSKVIGDVTKEMFYTRQGYKNCNKYLSKIAEQLGRKEKITTYVARHSWATIAKTLGYSKDLIAEALGHEYGNKVTGIYLDNYNNEVIDEVNEQVTK